MSKNYFFRTHCLTSWFKSDSSLRRIEHECCQLLRQGFLHLPHFPPLFFTFIWDKTAIKPGHFLCLIHLSQSLIARKIFFFLGKGSKKENVLRTQRSGRILPIFTGLSTCCAYLGIWFYQCRKGTEAGSVWELLLFAEPFLLSFKEKHSVSSTCVVQTSLMPSWKPQIIQVQLRNTPVLKFRGRWSCYERHFLISNQDASDFDFMCLCLGYLIICWNEKKKKWVCQLSALILKAYFSFILPEK